MIRILLVSAAALVLAACGQDAPKKDEPSAQSPAQGAEAGVLEARVNMAPVDPAKAKPLMHMRHEKMEEIRDEVKALRRQFDSSAPDKGKIAASATKIDALARQAGNWFPAGTGPDVGKTMAKPEIWQKPQDFAAKMTDLQAKAEALKAAAAGNDTNAAKSAFAALGKTCKSCHDLYRKEH